MGISKVDKRVRGKPEIDLTIDPPPDLVVEVERTHSAINKLELLAAIGVPELWRYDGQSLWLGTLVGENFEPITSSTVLDGFPVADAQHTLQQIGTASATQLIRQFVAKL